MIQKSFLAAIFGIVLLAIPSFAYADNSLSLPPPEAFYRAYVLSVTPQEKRKIAGYEHSAQLVELKILNGPDEGKIFTMEQGGEFRIRENEKVVPGETVVVSKLLRGDTVEYSIGDRYRLPSLGWLLVIFFTFVVFFGGKRGVTALFGLAFTLLILAKWVAPAILKGGSPFLISLAGAFFIALISLYVAHGFNKRTSLAVVSTFVTLGLVALFAYFSVSFSKLFGLGDEDAYFLQNFTLPNTDFRGLLLGGIIIGALGVLDDITTGQTAAVAEIHAADPKLSFQELYHRGLSVGKEHIASLVNTLALAYVGASFPLILMFALNTEIPLWLNINSELLAEEIVRTIVGSTALVLAVPIATFFAAYFFRPREKLFVALAKNAETKSTPQRQKFPP